jgi:threonine 3-dehydrogenase
MPTTMQAVVKAHAAPGIELREAPIPSPGPGEVLVRVQAASVCGTDLHIFN